MFQTTNQKFIDQFEDEESTGFQESSPPFIDLS